MTKIASAVADRFLNLVSPRAEAFAACSGSYYVCSGHGCKGDYYNTDQYRCTTKPNCTDVCSLTGVCCVN